MNRDHLAHVPAGYGKKQAVQAGGKTVVLEARVPCGKRGPGRRGGRPPKYQGPAFIRLLTLIWEDHGRLCGKLLAAMIDFLASSKEPDYGITGELKTLVETISGAQIDRLLAPARKALELRG